MKLPKRLKVHKATEPDAGPSMSTVLVSANAVSAVSGSVVAAATRESPRELIADKPTLIEGLDVHAYASVGLHLEKAPPVAPQPKPTAAQNLPRLAGIYRKGKSLGSIEIEAGNLRRALDAIGADATTIVRVSVVEDAIGASHLELSCRWIQKRGEDIPEQWLAGAIVAGLRAPEPTSKPLAEGGLVISAIAREQAIDAGTSTGLDDPIGEGEAFCCACGVVADAAALAPFGSGAMICADCSKPKADDEPTT